MKIELMYIQFLISLFKDKWQNAIFISSQWVAHFLPVFATENGIFFAAEDEGRTEEPTERRKRKEREKGRVPKSAEIPAALVTLGGILALFFAGGWIVHRLLNLIEFYVGNFHNLPALNESSIRPLMAQFIENLALLLLPVFGIGMLLAIAGNVMQTGFLFSLKPLQFDFSRIKLDFATLARKVFFSRQVAVNLMKTLAKVTLMGLVAYWIVYADFMNILQTPSLGVGEALKTIGMTAFKLALVLSLILAAVSIPDYFFQRFEFMESIKMTKQEVKEEYKETEGDPLVKQRQRQMAMDLLRRNMLGNIKEADVVITNPTHYAVALRYDNAKEEAPRVVAKGVDAMALQIRHLAEEFAIPIIENKPLARQLYAQVEVNQIIPQALFEAVVAIYSMLISEGKYRRMAS
ncbi:MAG: flagellar biosynthesis protein FlhB [Candidatus Hydrogenedentota bacterium]|nr:MAG: flagellar biosynthesis protein FlhB [Candidatus Hydrogenedentota bacterium]